MTSITGRTPEYFAIIIIEFQHLSELWVTHRQSDNQESTSWPDSVNQLLGIDYRGPL